LEGFRGCRNQEEKEGGKKWEEESGDWRRRRRNLERERIFRGKRNEVEEKFKKVNKWGVSAQERERESEGMMECQAWLSLTET